MRSLAGLGMTNEKIARQIFFLGEASKQFDLHNYLECSLNIQSKSVKFSGWGWGGRLGTGSDD